MVEKLRLSDVDVYARKLLIGRAELAILRTGRLGAVTHSDQNALAYLSEYLNLAIEGDKIVSGFSSSNPQEESLEILKEILGVFLMRERQLSSLSHPHFKGWLTKLGQTAQALSEGVVPKPNELDELKTFTHDYGLYLRDKSTYGCF